MDALLALTKQHGIALIEDSAQAIRGLNLPSGFNMTPDKIHYVSGQIRDILRALVPTVPHRQTI